jgi:hypothetical protein
LHQHDKSLHLLGGVIVNGSDVCTLRRIDELHLQLSFYGSRKLTRELHKEGHDVGHR